MRTTPDVIGRYEIQRTLGAGGMGTLYLARDPAIDRLVAIKVLREGLDDAELRERFKREARSAGRMHHPHIVTIFDVGDDEGRPFIAMEFIEGDTLADIEHADALELADEARAALEAAPPRDAAHDGEISALAATAVMHDAARWHGASIAGHDESAPSVFGAVDTDRASAPASGTMRASLASTLAGVRAPRVAIVAAAIGIAVMVAGANWLGLPRTSSASVAGVDHPVTAPSTERATSTAPVGNGRGDRQAASIDTLQMECDHEDGAACDELGDRYYSGRTVTRDPVRARQPYERACDRGVATGCVRLGVMYAEGKGVAKDAERAQRF